MTTKTPKVTLERLKAIIAEEIQSVNEAVDHKTINGIVGVASKLLAAVEAFKEKAPPAAINATTPHLGELERVLENMLSTPASYVPRVKKEPKTVSLTSKGGKKEESVVREGEVVSMAQPLIAAAQAKGLTVEPVEGMPGKFSVTRAGQSPAQGKIMDMAALKHYFG